MAERAVIDLASQPSTVLPRITLPSAKLTAEVVELPDPAPYEFSVQGGAHYLAWHDLTFTDGLMRVEGDRSYRSVDLRGKLTFFPAHTEAAGWCKPVARPQGFTALYIDPAAIPEMLLSEPCWDRPAVYFESGPLGQTMAKIAHALKQPLPFRDLLIESLGQVALGEFLASQARAAKGAPERALGSSDLRRLNDYLRANLSRQIHLEEMARVVGLSKFHFIRCFRAATQRTPYRALLELRTEVALQQLKAGRTLREASVAAGFDDAAQMARTMRNIAGLTPRDILRTLK